jgi:hypothetical protein
MESYETAAISALSRLLRSADPRAKFEGMPYRNCATPGCTTRMRGGTVTKCNSCHSREYRSGPAVSAPTPAPRRSLVRDYWGDRRNTAEHEADHAYICALRGVMPESVKLHSAGGGTTTAPEGISKSVLLDVFLAGAVGEIQRDGSASAGCAGDVRSAFVLATELVGPLRADDEIEKRSRRIMRELKDGGRKVRALAKALAATGHGSMSGTQAVAILQRTAA